MDSKVEPDAPTPEASGEDRPTVSSLHSMEMAHCSNSCLNMFAVADSTGAAQTNMTVSHEEPQEMGESPSKQPDIAAGAICPIPTSVLKKGGKLRGHRYGRRGIAKSQLTCKVDGCNAVLSASKAYYQRHRVCAAHLAAMSAAVDGVECRFCQQCGKFQPVEEFDSDKRSCRARLKRHNNRRREQRHSKSSHQPCPPIPDTVKCIFSAGLACLDPSNVETPAGPIPQGTADTGSNTTQASPNPSGDNSCSAAVQVAASPGTPAGPVPAVISAATAAAGVVGAADGLGRSSMRRSSANKALAAFKAMNAPSQHADFEDNDMEEDHQRSPMVAPAPTPTAFKPRRRLNMAAATAASFAAPEGQQAAAYSAQLQGSAAQRPGLGFSSFKNAEIAAAIEAASAGGSYNKCALSLAGSSASNELGFSSRPQLGRSRFAQQSSAVAAVDESGPPSHGQQQQWEQDGNSSFLSQSSSRFTAATISSQYPHDPGDSTAHIAGSRIGVSPCTLGDAFPGQVLMWPSGSLAHQHSAPPLLQADDLEAAYAGPGTAIRAAGTASRFSDAGQLMGSAARYSCQHQQPGLLQQQSLPSIRTAEDPFTATPAAGAASYQQYNFNAALAAESEIRSYDAVARQQQDLALKQHLWQQQSGHTHGNAKPLSLQVLIQLRNRGLLASPGLLACPTMQHQQQYPHAHLQVPAGFSQASTAGTAVSGARASESGLMALPAQAGTLQQHPLLGRPYVSYSGAEGQGTLLQSPGGSLTAPLRGDLAGISLDRTGSFAGWQGDMQQRQQQHSSWPGGHLVQPEQQLAALEQQQQDLQHVLVKQGSLQPQQLQPGFQAHEPSHKVAATAGTERVDGWMQHFASTNEQTLQTLQQQQAQQGHVQPQQLTELAPVVPASMPSSEPVCRDTPLQHARLEAGPAQLVSASGQYETEQQLSVKEPAATEQQYASPLSPEHYLPTDDAYAELQHPCPETSQVVPYSCTDGEAAVAAAAEYEDSPFDEDFGDLLDILLEEEAAGQ